MVVRHRRLGPRDEGRILSTHEYAQCEDAPGFITEIIDGVVRVSPSARPIHFSWQRAVTRHLEAFAAKNPSVLNMVATDCDVVIPNRPGETRPRPDVAAYRHFPAWASVEDGRDDWSFYSPILAVEVISPRRARKDTLRNRNLYWLCNAILEYWIVDPRKSKDAPRLLVHVRETGYQDWVVYELGFEEAWQSQGIEGLEICLARLGR